MRWLTLLLLPALCGCFELFPPNPDVVVVGPGPAPGPGECLRNIDCGAGQICQGIEGDTPGRCVQVACVEDGDCDEGAVCVTHLGQCAAVAECTPGAGECPVGSSCRVVGDAARCSLDDAWPFDACEISPRTLVLSQGDTRPLVAHGDQLDERYEVDVPATWSSDVGGVNGTSLLGTCLGPEPCKGTVTATTGGASCTADVVILPPVPEGSMRVVVTEADGGAPVAGARVVLRAGPLFEGITDEHGVLERPVVVPPDAVTVIADGYAWQTVVGVGGDTVALALDREPGPSELAGVTGAVDLTSAPTVGELRVGIGGLSLSPSLSMRPDWRSLIGRPRTHPFALEGVTQDGDQVLVSDGVTFELGDNDIKPWFASLSVPRRALVWGGGARVPLSEIGTVLNVLQDGTFVAELGSRFFWAWLPFLGGSTHAAPLTVDVDAAARTGEPLPDPAALFDVGVLEPATVPRQLLAVPLPERPCRDGASACGRADRLDALFVVPLAVAPGFGAVPLGFGAARDADGDGALEDVTVWRGLEDAPNAVRVALAPRHNGLERAAERVWVFATDATDHLDNAAPMSGVLTDRAGAAGGVTLPALPTAHLDRDDATFTVTSPDAGGLFRARLRTIDDRRHDVWLAGGATTVTLTDVLPDDLEPRTARAELEAMTLADGDAGFGRAGVGTGDALARLVSYASVACGSGSICLAE